MKTHKETPYREWLCVVALLASFFLIRIYNSSQVFFLPNGGDDWGYFIYTEALFKTHTLDWCATGFTPNTIFTPACEEYAHNSGKVGGAKAPRPYNRYTPGSAILLLPFTAFGLFLHKAGIFSPVSLDPLIFWSVVGVFFLFYGCLLLLYEIGLLVLDGAADIAFWTAVFVSAGSILDYYVFRRPLMSHAPEIFLFLLTFYLYLRASSGSGRAKAGSLFFCFFTGLASGLLFLTRINDVWWVAILGLLFIGQIREQNQQNWKNLFTRTALYSLGVLPFLFLFLFLQHSQRGTFSYHSEDYHSTFTLPVLFAFRFSNLRRIFDFFIGPHWGAVLLMPFLGYELYVIARGWRIFYDKIRENPLLFSSITLIVFLYLNMMANLGNHTSYGFRILLPIYYGVHLIFLYSLKGQMHAKLRGPSFKKFLLIGCFCSVIGCFNLINFESNATTLTLTLHRAEDAGVYNPLIKDNFLIDAPNYALHSLWTTFTGRALKNLVAAPLLSYPLMAAEPLIPKTPLFERAFEYYKSPKRNIYHLGDLKLLTEYLLWITGLLFLFICFLNRKTLVKSRGNRK